MLCANVLGTRAGHHHVRRLFHDGARERDRIPDALHAGDRTSADASRRP